LFNVVKTSMIFKPYCSEEATFKEPQVNCTELYFPHIAFCQFNRHCVVQTNQTDVPILKDVTLDMNVQWTDSLGDNCESYREFNYCSNGTYGPSWDVSGWGLFHYYAVDGIDASDMCYSCGGGTFSSRNYPIDWVDSDNLPCSYYASERWCEDGVVGESWDPTWGTIDDYGVVLDDGFFLSALDVCVVCGGGSIGDELNFMGGWRRRRRRRLSESRPHLRNITKTNILVRRPIFKKMKRMFPTTRKPVTQK